MYYEYDYFFKKIVLFPKYKLQAVRYLMLSLVRNI